MATPTIVGRGSASPVGPVLAAGAATLYVGLAAVLDPYADQVVGCPVHGLTGGFCPGCGSTRAVHELAHGDLSASLACHPLVLPVALLLTYLWASWAVRRRRHGRPAWARTPTELPVSIPLLLTAALVALTVVRNLPGAEWLVPPEVAP